MPKSRRKREAEIRSASGNVDLLHVPIEIAAVLIDDPRLTWIDVSDRESTRVKLILSKINHIREREL